MPGFNQSAQGFLNEADDPYSRFINGFNSPQTQKTQRALRGVGRTAQPVAGYGAKKNAQMGKADYSDSNLQSRTPTDGDNGSNAPQSVRRQPVPAPDPYEGSPEQLADRQFNQSGYTSGPAGNMTYKKGPFKGMTMPEAFQSVQDQKVNREPDMAAANTGISRVDESGNPIRPKFGYSKYGQPQDLDPNRVNPYRDFSTTASGFKPSSSLGTDNFQLRKEAERREREDHYRFFDRQDANKAAAQGAVAVREKKLAQVADRMQTQKDIEEYGSATDKKGITRLYNKEAREYAGKANAAARDAYDKSLPMEERKIAAGNFMENSAMGRATQRTGPEIRTMEIPAQYGGGYAQASRGIEPYKPSAYEMFETRSGVPMTSKEAFSTDKVPGYEGIYETGLQGRGAKGMAKELLDAGSRAASDARRVSQAKSNQIDRKMFRDQNSVRR